MRSIPPRAEFLQDDARDEVYFRRGVLDIKTHRLAVRTVIHHHIIFDLDRAADGIDRTSR